MILILSEEGNKSTETLSSHEKKKNKSIMRAIHSIMVNKENNLLGILKSLKRFSETWIYHKLIPLVEKSVIFINIVFWFVIFKKIDKDTLKRIKDSLERSQDAT